MPFTLEAAKNTVCERITRSASDVWELAQDLFENPEIGKQEYRSARVIAARLKSMGYRVEMGVAGYDTAFLAEYKGGSDRPRVALLAEYDALPEIGHACGHNLIAAGTYAAALGLSALGDQLPGSVVVIGTPAEETDGAKVVMVDSGIFSEIDAALMFHPCDETAVRAESLALDALEVTFFGRTVNPAIAPEKGASALQAAVQLFVGVNALSQHLPKDVSIHGVIIEGGTAANIVPDRCVARFYLRAATRQVLDHAVSRFRDCVQAASLISGTTFSIAPYELSFDNIVSNPVLERLMEANLRQLGFHEFSTSRLGGSTDMGNVSQVVPAIHAYVAIAEKGTITHTKEFVHAVTTDRARQATIQAGCALAMTCLDLFYKKELIEDAKRYLPDSAPKKTGSGNHL